MGEDSIVTYLDLVDRTKPAADAAYLRLQKQAAAGYGPQTAAEDRIRSSTAGRSKAQEGLIRGERILTGEKVKQVKAGSELAEIDTKGRVRAKSFKELAETFTTMEGLKSRTLSLFGGQIGSLMLYTAVIGGVTGALRAVVGGQADLQESTAKLGIVFDSTRENVAGLTVTAREWALAHGQGARDVAEAMYELGAAGRTVEQTQSEIRAVALLAEGGLLKLGDSAEIVTTQVNTFAREGMSAVGAANIIQATAASTQVRVEDLGQALKYSAAGAVTAGLSFKELNATLGTLGNLGLRGSIAGTGLNRVFAALAQKRSQIRELGIEVDDASGKMRPFFDIIADFRSRFGTQISGPEKALLETLFDMRGARVMERLLSDSVTLQRVMKDLDKSETEVFRAAEEGSDTLKESWKVFGNQLLNIALMNGEVAEGLQATLDAITDRKAKRALENIMAGSAGAQYEIDRLNAKMLEGHGAAEDWARSMLRAADDLEGPLGRKLRALQDIFGQVARPSISKSIVWSLTSALTPGDMAVIQAEWGRWLTQKWTPYDVVPPEAAGKIREVIAEYKKLVALQESQRRGKSIIETMFGVGPVSVTGAEAALEIQRTSQQEQQRYARAQQQEAEEGLRRLTQYTEDNPLFSNVAAPLIANLTMVRDEWKRTAEEMAREFDVAVEQDRKKWILESAKGDVAILKSEMELLSSVEAFDYESRSRMASKRLQVQLAEIDAEAEAEKEALWLQRDDALDNLHEITERRDQVDEAADNKRRAARNAERNEQRRIAFDRLRGEYETAGKIADLEERLALGGMDASARAAVERMADIRKLWALSDYLTRQVKLGVLPPEQAADQFRLAGLQFEIEDRKRVRDAKTRQMQLDEIEGEITVTQAKEVLVRTQGIARFAQEKIVIQAEAAEEEQRINAEYAAAEVKDAKKRDLELQKLGEETALKLAQNFVDMAEAERVAMLDSIGVIGQGFQGLSQLIEVTSGKATAKLLADFSTAADAVGGTLNLMNQMKLGAISGFAGTLGIMGVIAGGIASIFGKQKRDDERMVRELTDEFRHQEGRNVSAQFGEARVYNVRIEQNNSIDFLAAPTSAQIRSLLWQIRDPLVKMLEEMGFESGGGA